MSRSPADIVADLAALAQRQAALTAELADALRDAPAPALPPGASEAPEYLTTREAVALLGVSVRHLEDMRRDGRGPAFVRVGRAVRYPRATLAAVQPPASASSLALPSVAPRAPRFRCRS